MTIGLLGRKVGITQIFDPTGEVIPVTVIQAGPCHVLQLKTEEQDGYQAVQLGYLDKPRRLASRSARGHVAKLESKRQKRRAAAGVEPAPKPACEPKRFIREFRGKFELLKKVKDEEGKEVKDKDGKNKIEIIIPTVGQELKVDLFSDIKAVDVIGTSKGRGTAGVMKRHGFRGQRASHGVKKVHRHAGSIGCNTDPHHVFKGHRMAGHYGHQRCTVRNLKVVKIDLENNLLVVRGAVPGPNGGYLLIRETNKLV